jgi:hypothetical protein
MRKEKPASVGNRPRRTRSTSGALPSKRQKRMSQKKKEAQGLATPSPIKKCKKKTNKKNDRVMNRKKSKYSNGSDDESSLNADTLACCICRCTADFSDRDFFSWPSHDIYHIFSTDDDDDQSKHDDFSEGSESDMDKTSHSAGGSATYESSSNHIDRNGSIDLDHEESQSGVNHNNSDEESSQGSQFYGFKFPSSLHDSNNALLICDGCDRCFHQRCHFVPVLAVPRNDWYCLICQYETHLLDHEKTKNGKKRKISKKVEKYQSGAIVMKDMLSIEASLPPSQSDLENIFRIPKGWNSDDGNRIIMSTDSNHNPNETFRPQDRFEFHSAQLKSELLQNETKKNLKAMINHQLSSIRMAQASIRAYISSARSRKALIEKYTSSKQLPQEFAQSVARLAQCKLKIREVMQCLQNVIWNRNDRQLLTEWIASIEVDDSGRIVPPLSNINDSAVPEVISIEHISNDSTISKQTDPLISKSELLVKVFVDDHVRVEPRFDIKDYDADEDDSDSLSEDQAEKIKCCVCFSGLSIPDENDILMCDGQGCFRSCHMKCCTPHVTQKMLDEDENGTWFCPLCVLFANALHYAETEFHATEMDEFQYGNEDDYQSAKSWENANDVFPESIQQLEVATKWKEGKRDSRSDSVLSTFLGVEVSTARKDMTNEDPKLESEVIGTDDDDSEDEEFSDGDADSNSHQSGQSDDVSSLEWDIDKTELRALSGSESSEDEVSDKEANSQARRSRRLLKEKELKTAIDSGKMDTANIVYGKRRRTKVDYCKLNDAMFSAADPKTIASVDDEEEYHYLEPKSRSSSKSGSSDNHDTDDCGTDDESEPSNDIDSIGSEEEEINSSSAISNKETRVSRRRTLKNKLSGH